MLLLLLSVIPHAYQFPQPSEGSSGSPKRPTLGSVVVLVDEDEDVG